MTGVPLVCCEDLHRMFGVESLASQLFFIYVGVLEVLVIKVEEPSILLLQHIPQPMECLDIPNKTRYRHYFHLLSVQVLEYCVAYDDVGEGVAVFDDVDLVEGKVVVDEENLIVDSLLLICRVNKHPLFDNFILLHPHILSEIELQVTRYTILNYNNDSTY